MQTRINIRIAKQDFYNLKKIGFGMRWCAQDDVENPVININKDDIGFLFSNDYTFKIMED